MADRIRWPDKRDFAFTIFDDTDLAHLPDIKTVYDFLSDIGLRTTKSVWPIRGGGVPAVGGQTCEDADYLQWVLQLQESGFEIGLHNVTFHTSRREDIRRGLDRFRELFGRDPATHANHVGCDENIYWGNARLTGLNEAFYNLLTRGRNRGRYQGHVETSPLFWGDLCRDRIGYVRQFVFRDINTLRCCPYMPYHDPLRSYVRAWFASSEGPTCAPFCETIRESAQDRLAAEGGACIMYTHFGTDFCADGRLDDRFRRLMERMAGRNGWFVPVRTLLDYLVSIRGIHTITDGQRRRLELRWLWDKIRTGGTT